jgi:hypothetical protein
MRGSLVGKGETHPALALSDGPPRLLFPHTLNALIALNAHNSPGASLPASPGTLASLASRDLQSLRPFKAGSLWCGFITIR